MHAESFRLSLQNKPVGREETFLQTFLINHAEFLVPTFCGSFWKSWRESSVVDDVLFSHEQEIYPSTSLDENSIEFELQTDRNYYVDLQSYSALKLKFVKGRGYEIYNRKDVERSTKERQKPMNKRRRRRKRLQFLL